VAGGEGTARLTGRAGIPIGWTTDGANRHDTVLFSTTLEPAQMALAITLVVTAKLIDWRDRWAA
jgi:hypothetical protein